MAIDAIKPQSPRVPTTLPGDLRLQDVAKPSTPPKTGAVVSDIFAQRVEKVAALLDGQRSPDVGRKELAAIQASRQLWQVGPSAEFSAVGNPFLVIPFSTAQEVASALFQREAGATYDLAVPKNAVAMGDDRVFVASLKKRDSAEKPQSRAIMVDKSGSLRGAECKSVEEVRNLFANSPSLADRLRVDAFGGDVFESSKGGIRIGDFGRGKDSAFEAKLELGEGKDVKSATVLLNNFGLAVPAAKNPSALDIAIAKLKLDAFEAIA
ncbi:MAG: hypothetical protein HYZ28_03555 [Myxococcales bacterium]|nr:hypothetical protein [Myxococcales bacterium]